MHRMPVVYQPAIALKVNTQAVLKNNLRLCG
jgi:hypothetical protein